MRNLCLLLLVLWLGSCGGASSGKIDITLNVGALNQTELDSIEHFIFIISDVNEPSSGTMYPSECLEESEGNICFSTSICGFSKSVSVFDPKIGFNDFEKGSNLQVRACALDASNGVVGVGVGSVENTDGESATISIDNATPCTGLPQLCS